MAERHGLKKKERGRMKKETERKERNRKKRINEKKKERNEGKKQEEGRKKGEARGRGKEKRERPRKYERAHSRRTRCPDATDSFLHSALSLANTLSSLRPRHCFSLPLSLFFQYLAHPPLSWSNYGMRCCRWCERRGSFFFVWGVCVCWLIVIDLVVRGVVVVFCGGWLVLL